MTSLVEKYFNRLYPVLCLLVFVVIALRAFFIPFSHDEVATFFYYIQSDNYLPYQAHVYTNNHVLNSALANICYHFAGSHRFVLRIPNLLSFLILCYGLHRHFNYLRSVSSRLMLVAFFILTFNLLDFFALCRGYGLSIAFMVLGLAYLQDYFTRKKAKYFFLFSLCWQLALAANLTLVIVLALLLFFVIIFQITNGKLFKFRTLVLQCLNVAILVFWVKFLFFYKERGMLDSGASTGYWQTTFKTLIAWLFGADNLWLQILVIAGFCLMGVVSLWQFIQSGRTLDAVFSGRFFYPIILVSLLVGFYLLNKLLGVNFPEDRTGIFFYVFYALGLAYVMDTLAPWIVSVVSGSLAAASLVYFGISLNFSDFTSPFYFTMPKAFYDTLKSEYDKTGQIFTLGGHRVRELNFAFLNYRGGAMLNHMDDAEQMHMNCDYYYAMKREEPYYRFFYDEIAYEKTWDHVLLKRKEKITRKEVAGVSNLPASYKGPNEFLEFLRVSDTSFRHKNCLEAELAITFNRVPQPFNAFLVFSIENTAGKTVYYKHIPLNMQADNLNGQTKYFKLVTGQMPADLKTAVVYVWNIDQKDLDLTLKSLRINELYGKGINFAIPSTFYPLVEKITKRPLL